MHNGMSYNHNDLLKEHSELGLDYSTYENLGNFDQFNDSESLGVEIVRFIEGKTKKIESYGPAAIFLVQVDKQTQKVKQIFFSRNDRNPMKMFKNNGQLFLSSEGKGTDVAPDNLYSFDPLSEKMPLTKVKMVMPPAMPSAEYKFDWKKEVVKDEEPVIVKQYSYNDDDVDFDQPRDIDNPLNDVEDDIINVVSEFINDLKLERENPFVVDQRDVMRQLNILLKDAIETAQDMYLHAPSLDTIKSNAR
jgi:hypothetical protein